MTRLGRRRDAVYLDGSRVEALRRERQLTQEELGSLIDRTRGHISRIESDPSYRVGRVAAEALASTLGAPLTALLRQEPKRRRSAVSAGSPITPQSALPEEAPVGAKVDAILDEEGLSPQEQEAISNALLPHVRALARLIKFAQRDTTSS